MGLVDRIPTVRKRFVARAAYLKERKEFRSFLREARDMWNSDHPAFAIRQDSGQRELKVPFLNPAIQRALGSPLRDDSADEAEMDWSQLVESICERWWPPEIFPPWARDIYYSHPAGNFVAACLLYNPTLADPDSLVAQASSTVSGVPFQPGAGEVTPHERYWQERYRVFADGVRHVVESGSRLTPDQLKQIDAEAREAAFAARQEAQSALRHGHKFGWRAAVPVFRGMTSEDWRSLEHTVIHMADDEGLLRREALRLRSDGLGYRRVAGELGVSVSTARRLLDAR